MDWADSVIAGQARHWLGPGAHGGVDEPSPAIAPWPHNTGAASSLLGFIQMMLSAGAGILVVVVSDGTQLAMVTAIAIGGVGSLVSHLVLGRRGPLAATAIA